MHVHHDEHSEGQIGRSATTVISFVHLQCLVVDRRDIQDVSSRERMADGRFYIYIPDDVFPMYVLFA